MNIASTAGTDAVRGMAAYAAAKAGVVALTRTAALDRAHRDVRVNAVSPGPIESGPIMRQGGEVREQVGLKSPDRA